MPPTPKRLDIREAVRRSRHAIWAHRGMLLGPVLAISAVQWVLGWATQWMEASLRALVNAIPDASLAVAWHQTLLLGSPMTLATLRRWTRAHWVFVGVMVAWQLPRLVVDALQLVPAFDGASIGIAVWLAALGVGARLSVVLPAWAIGDERHQTPAAAWRLTYGHGADLVFMTLWALLWGMLLMAPILVVTESTHVASGELNIWLQAVEAVLMTLARMIGIGALSYAYCDLTATEIQPGRSDVLGTGGGGLLTGS